MSRAIPTSAALAVPAAVASFHSMLCGVDGSRAAAEAARQAAILSTVGGRLTLLGVGWEEVPRRRSTRATIEPHRLAAALETARLEGRSLGIAPTARLVESREHTSVLLTHATDYDLLVLGASSPSRATGVLAGRTAAAAVRSAPVPVLLARRPPEGVDFPSSILAAIDGTPSSAYAVATAARLASVHGARLLLAASSDVLSAADSLGAALVVIGSRGFHGVSLSERVAHEAPCSVLVLRRHD
jgi:nucleotide-binding universal stress UspA family protein